MKVRVLGCSGAIAKDCRTTSFLIDNNILVDAGTGVGDLTLNEMTEINHVFLTHSHLDHIAALPLMVDSVSSFRKFPLQIHALPATIDALRTHIFNNIIWPDFGAIPSVDEPFVRFLPLHAGEQRTVAGLTIEALPAVHTVPALGYAIRGSSGWWVFSGDTERNPAFWQRINELHAVMLVIETAFSDCESALARRSLHLSPTTLLLELQSLELPDCKVFITHTKPAQTTVILAEICTLQMDSTAPRYRKPIAIDWLEAGQQFAI
ncbi:MAG: 3',5'-cyclic-nucleotide phosphodiesterase [Acidovorax sp.]|nr:MAG: 3',5'-cyclic-nucleotide phosphodiesterase [Acidovorax sp.]